MTAEEARKLNAEYLKTLLLGDEAIDKRIAEAAKLGKTGIYIDLEEIEYKLRDDTFLRIQKVYGAKPKNFTIKRERFSDVRDGSGSDGIFISW